MSSHFQDEKFWIDQWQRKLSRYQAAPARTGLFIEHLFTNTVDTVLELGAGSCRDSVHLAKRGYRCMASDFSKETIRSLKSQLAVPGLRFSFDDARNLSFETDEFDLVFHNGLIVCFDNDDDIIAILREQRRVAKSKLLIIAHNGSNRRLVRQFTQLGENDCLYRIRFFTCEEITDLLRRAGVTYRRLRMLKFGGPADALYGDKIKGVPNPFTWAAPSLSPRLYALQPWSRTERIAALVEL